MSDCDCGDCDDDDDDGDDYFFFFDDDCGVQRSWVKMMLSCFGVVVLDLAWSDDDDDDDVVWTMVRYHCRPPPCAVMPCGPELFVVFFMFCCAESKVEISRFLSPKLNILIQRWTLVSALYQFPYIERTTTDSIQGLPRSKQWREVQEKSSKSIDNCILQSYS